MAKDNIIPFYKMTGGSNDFVVLDNRKNVLPEDYANLAKTLCVRKFSIGADGLLILEKSEKNDFRMAYYNSDGSRADMCANGARCISRFATLVKAAGNKMSFDTDAGVLSAEVKDESVKLKMSQPKDLRTDFPIRLEDDKEFSVSFINTGVPHAVVMVADLEKTDVSSLGKAIRYHKEFAPQGTNVNFVSIRDDHSLDVRTYERGVEEETLACGTGVAASSLICALKGFVKSPVSCLTRGGETLTVYFELGTIPIQELYLEGSATVCFNGEVEI